MNTDRFKFRAWDKDASVMRSYNWVDGLGVSQLRESESLIPLQCTGLKDSEGKLIYEGDILQWEEMIGTIEFVYAAFQFNQDNIHIPLFGNGKWKSSMKVIGNIYENPKLLEEAK